MYLLNAFKRQNSKTRKDKGQKRKPGLLSINRKASYAGHLAKSTLAGAVTGGTVGGLVSSAIPALMPVGASIGAVDGAIKGAVLGSAAYGLRKGLEERKKKK